jgi:hypothetical protein
MRRPLYRSPLEKVVHDPKLTQILEAMRNSIHLYDELQISREDVCHVRKAFSTAIETGERGLYTFAQDLADEILGGKVFLFSEVWGRCFHREHRGIQKSQTRLLGSFRDLYGERDSDRSFFHAPLCWCGEKTSSIASFVKGMVKNENPLGIQLISTRIKTPSNLAYKVADILFDIDKMFRRDKVLNRYSQIVKDVYGIKIITTDFKFLKKGIQWFERLPCDGFFEVKDYLGPKRKKSGFKAYKLVLQKNDQIFEVQLQTQTMFERENIGFRENHLTYKERQMRLRARLGERYEELQKALEILLCLNGPSSKGIRLNHNGIDEEPEENGTEEEFNKYTSCQPNKTLLKRLLNEEVRFA